AQPGDLIVWPGHVGLVVDPDQRTFFSRTGSGPRTDDYTSDYWRTRGHPRFYRYVVSDESHLAAQLFVAQATAPNRAPEPERSSPGSNDADVIASDPSASLRPDPIPENIQIFAERGGPAREDIEEGLSELGNASASALESENRQRVSVALVRE